MTTLPIPTALLNDLREGRRPITSFQKQRLTELLTLANFPSPELYDLNSINRENQLWKSEQVKLFLGEDNSEYFPGTINPELAWIIGETDIDGPIALDFRVTPPRVVYFGVVGNMGFWIELATSYEALIASITPPTSSTPFG